MEQNTYNNIIENALNKWNVPNKKVRISFPRKTGSLEWEIQESVAMTLAMTWAMREKKVVSFYIKERDVNVRDLLPF